MTKRLSERQKFILVLLYVYDLRGWISYPTWGLPIRELFRQNFKSEGWTRSNSASVSRSLRTLERRGLINRLNHVTEGERTTNVKLTDNGTDMAKRLCNERDSYTCDFKAGDGSIIDLTINCYHYR